MSICIVSECQEEATRLPTWAPDITTALWCDRHYGVYPHNCERSGCNKIVIYDDEPYCFADSPDEGSSVPGYSAYCSGALVS